MIHPSLAAMVDTIRLAMTREGLHHRFTTKAVEFMKLCVAFILKQRVNTMATIDSSLLNHFTSIKIFDSTSWNINPALRNLLPGSGGTASSASCKVQLCYEYLRGTLSFFEVTPGNNPDNRYAKQLPDQITAGDLLIADLGYFYLQMLSDIVKSGAFFLFRYMIGTTLYDAKTTKEMDLRNMLQKVNGGAYEMNVLMGRKEKSRVACRLICLRVDEKTAAERRRKLNAIAAKKGRQVSELSLFMAGWILMVTNIPSEWIPAEMVRPMYSLRWQIELLFKELKSVLLIHKSATGNESRLHCEILGKLIVAIVIHRIHANVNIKLWNVTRQEISMDKLFKRLQERAFALKDLLCRSLSLAVKYLKKELDQIMKNCRKLNQKSRPTTLEIIDRRITIFSVDYLECD
jgi:hypothetical protein